jgi:hypothetical protein
MAKGSTTYEERVTLAAMEVFRRVAAGESLTYRLCQAVIDEMPTPAPPARGKPRASVVMFEATSMLASTVKTARLKAG